jgi:hypothetical protein
MSVSNSSILEVLIGYKCPSYSKEKLHEVREE